MIRSERFFFLFICWYVWGVDWLDVLIITFYGWNFQAVGNHLAAHVPSGNPNKTKPIQFNIFCRINESNRKEWKRKKKKLIAGKLQSKWLLVACFLPVYSLFNLIDFLIKLSAS